jgi:hypothetical protein
MSNDIDQFRVLCNRASRIIWPIPYLFRDILEFLEMHPTRAPHTHLDVIVRYKWTPSVGTSGHLRRNAHRLVGDQPVRREKFVWPRPNKHADLTIAYVIIPPAK